MRELVGSKNTIGEMTSVLKKLQKATLTFLPLYLFKFVAFFVSVCTFLMVSELRFTMRKINQIN